MLVLVDTHCHLDFNLFDNDRNEVISRAKEAGLERILNPGINIASSQNVLEYAITQELLYAAVGIHPNEASSWQDDYLDVLENLASNKKVVAIGEIGLDYYRDFSPREFQMYIFQQQLDLAGEVGLPVVIHNRDASEDVINILSDWCSELIRKASPLVERPGVLHSFSSDLKMAKSAIELNFYIGFTGPVTFRKAEQLRQIVIELPLEKLLIETDAPFLTPHPYRGRRNEPAYVHYVAEKIAEVKKISLEEVASTTTQNAKKLFLW